MPTTNVKPTSDVTTNWTPTPGGAHWSTIDELASSPDDNDYIETTTLDAADEFGLGDVPANTDQVTQVTLHIRARITDSNSLAYIRCELFTGGNPVTGNPKDVSIADLGGSGVYGVATKTWSGLTLSRSQANALQLRTTFKTA